MKIIEHRYWTMAGIRQVCIANDLYTCGTNDEYASMLNWAAEREPTPEIIYTVAKDIAEHSTGETIRNIMCMLTPAIAMAYELKEA